MRRDDDGHVAPAIVAAHSLEQRLAVSAHVFDVDKQQIRSRALERVDQTPRVSDARDLITLLAKHPCYCSRRNGIAIGHEHV
jgi:hypothetical protein